jgi:uncharacterized protein involved in exopolysaccharide biosynthesis
MTKNLADELQRTARQALAGLQPTALGEEAGGLPFRRLIAAAFRARYLVFGTTLFGLLVGTFLAITTANTYVSEGKFLFTSSGAEKVETDSTGTRQTSQETIATAASYILNSQDLLKKVVKRLGPARILAPYDPGGADATGPKAWFFGIQRDWNATKESDRTADAALRQLMRTVTVERPRYTDVLVATCSANNPELAQEILATWMDEAIQTHIEKYDNKKAYEEAQRTYEDTQKRLSAAKRAMNTFLNEKAKVIRFDDERRRLELDQIAALAERDKLAADVAVADSQLKAYLELIDGPKALPQYVTRKVRPSMVSGELSLLESRKATAEEDLSSARRTYQEGALEIKAMESKVKDLDDSIKRLRAAARDEPLVDEQIENPQWANAVTERNKLQSELTALRAKLDLTKDQFTAKSKALQHLLELEPEYEALNNTLVQAQEARESAQILWHAVEQKKLLALGNFSSLKEIQAAQLPLEKEGPNRGKLLVGAVLVGLFFGLGLVVLRALPDVVVRTRDDLEQIEGLAVIGVMPKLDGANLRRHEALREQGW